MQTLTTHTVADMDKRILELIADFHRWRGDTYKLAAQIVELQKEIDRDTLVNAGFSEQADLIV